MSKPSKAPQVNCWYRIQGQTIYCTRWEVKLKDDPDTIHMEGYSPQSYAAYVTQHYIGEREHPYRTVAEIEGIPYPEPIRVSFSIHTEIKELDREEALK